PKLCLDTAAPCVNIDLVLWALHPQELTTQSGGTTYIDLKPLLRDSTKADPTGGSPYVPVIDIKSMVAGDSVYVLLQPTLYQPIAPDIPGINVQVTPDAGPFSSPPYYNKFFHPNTFRCDYPTGCPNPKRELGAFA